MSDPMPDTPTPPLRPHRRMIRLSDEELSSLTGRAVLVRRPLARYIREAALNTLPTIVQGTSGPAEREVVRHLLRMGNNLNQLAREANARDLFPEARKLDAVREAINALVAQMGRDATDRPGTEASAPPLPPAPTDDAPAARRAGQPGGKGRRRGRS